MCGINGLIYFDGRDFDPSTLKNMCDQMIHRGPDDEGIYYALGIGLGFRRLSIIDTQGAQQPIANEDKTLWLVCNGEIYNYKHLREILTAKGHKFRTAGDAETIIHLYEEYGKDCVHHLRGMFAFILWDSKTKTFFAARDHFGIKPFYYTFNQDRLLCSSEIKSIIFTGLTSPALNMQSLVYYLTYQYVPDPYTMFEGVMKLPPAHRLTVQQGKISIERYWSPEFLPLNRPASKMQREIVDVLQQSVKLHMQSDVPRGCFLSSGIDSTAIATLMRQHEEIKTFSVGFEGLNNECDVSGVTAKILKTEHHQWLIGEQDYFNAVKDCIWYQDDPVADPSAVALYLVSKLASQHVKVVLSGEGADELFGGYRIYQEPIALATIQWMTQPFKETLNQLVYNMPNFYGKNYLLRATTPLEQRFVGNAKIFTDEVYQLLVDSNKYNHMQNAFQWAKQYYDQVSKLDDITKMQYIDLNLWLPGNILAKADKMTMANSLELRVPFLDREVFDVARTIPTKYRVDKTTTKRILREALTGIVPDHVIDRPKLGFPVPLRDWLRGKRGDICLGEIRHSGICQYIVENYATQLVRHHQAGKRDNSRKIWTIYVLAQWYNQFVARRDTATIHKGVWHIA